MTTTTHHRYPRRRPAAPPLPEAAQAWLALPQWVAVVTRSLPGCSSAHAVQYHHAATFDAALALVVELCLPAPLPGEVRQVELRPRQAS